MSGIVNVVSSTISKYQHIMLAEHNGMLTLGLDGAIQTVLPNDEYYGILTAPNQRCEKLVILGGGDMTCLPVLNRRGFTEWDMYEIDAEVVNICSPHIPEKPAGWETHVHFEDAVAALEDGRAKAPHIIEDMFGMDRINLLSDVTPERFIDLLCENAGWLVTGYVSSNMKGMLLGELLRIEFAKRGFGYYTTLLASSEVYFYASRKPLVLPERVKPFVIGYAVVPKDTDIAEFSLSDQLQIIEEAF